MTPTNWISIAGIGVVVILAVYAFVYRLDRRVGMVEGRCSNHQNRPVKTGNNMGNGKGLS